MKIITPEEFLGVKAPKFYYHHGTCDACGRKFVMVLHFGYDTQPERDYRVCEKCFGEAAFGMDKKVGK